MKLTRFVSASGFDVLLPWYDPLVTWFTCERAVKAHLIEQAVLRDGQRILDVGCGSGTLLLLTRPRAPRAELVGVDVDVRILAQARHKLNYSGLTTTLHTANSTHLPMADNSFDIVFCSLVFHHLNRVEKQLTLAEILRVLIPGGKLLLADYCKPANPYGRLAFLIVRLVDGWSRTRCNVRGHIPALIAESGLANVTPTFQLTTPLGTIRSYQATKPLG